jgi:hypothetical protein
MVEDVAKTVWLALQIGEVMPIDSESIEKLQIVTRTFTASEMTWPINRGKCLFRELAFHPGRMLVVQS